MEAKKSNKANIERRRKSFLLIGTAVATSFVLMAFEWSSVSYKTELTSLVEERPYIIPLIDPIIEVIKPAAPIAPIVEKVNNEIIEVVENIVDIKNDDNNKEEIEVIVPPKDLTFQKNEGKYDNFIDDVEGVEKIETLGPSIKVPYYDYCKDDSYNEKIQCISNEIHKSIGSGLANVTSYQIESCKKSKMYVQFVINKEGQIEELKIAGEENFNKEIVKMVMKSMVSVPKMNPALKNGKPVSVYFSIPINFNVQ